MPSSLMDMRRAGVVLHPTSLPGPHGSGDLGPNAFDFVDWLNKAGQTLWQTLPLGPVGPGFSPYMGSSVFAGNPMLVAFEPMLARGWLSAESLQAEFDYLKVNYPAVMPWRMARLREAYAGFVVSANSADLQDMAQWVASQNIWLEDYAMFMALDLAFFPRLWPQWPAPLAHRDPAALAQARQLFADELGFWRFVQWQFDQQWQALKSYAHSKDVLMVGDLPIFVAHHGADCWARPDLYLLDVSGQPKVVAGVPPDYFSATGQRWGNPLYNWDAMQADGYRWWIARVKRQLALADMVRIDHFRGFVDFWEIPADELTAVKGRWQNGPGDAFFAALTSALGSLPIIAEDLGIITDEVMRLRERTGFPGMRVMQFAFSGGDDHPFLPHNYDPNTVVYTGTHDNDTLLGWFASCSDHERAFALRYLNVAEEDFTWALLRAAAMSVAKLSLCQFQDVLELGTAHRMNVPGTTEGCWTWRFSWDWVTPESSARLAQIAVDSARTGQAQPDSSA